MLHIALLILKIIGIVLLTVLGIVLFLLCCVLFIPVTYRAEMKKDTVLFGKAEAGWLFRILTVRYELRWAKDREEDLAVRLFGIRIYTLLGGKKKAKKSRIKRENEEEFSAVEEVSTVKESGSGEKEPDSGTETHTEGKKTSSGKKKDFEGRRQSTSRIDETKKRFYAFLSKYDKIKAFWNEDTHVTARKFLYKQAWYLVKKIRPRRLEGRIRFGFEDPSLTGQLYGAACMLYVWYPKKFYLEPDFEHQVLEGNLKLCGSIPVYALVIVALKVLFHKETRRMYKAFRKL